MAGIRPTQPGSPRSAKALLRVARGQLHLPYRFELPVGNSAALALVGEEGRNTDTIFDPEQSSDLSRFFGIFFKIFEPLCAVHLWRGGPVQSAFLARFKSAADSGHY